MQSMNPLDYECPVCEALAGKYCSVPGSRGRRQVPWVHPAREERATPRVYLTSGAPGSEHDPEPWAYSRTSKSGEGLFGTPDRSAERWDRAMHWFPRPEFDHHNPILVDLREYWAHHGTRLSAEHARVYLQVTNLEAFDATPEQLAHARRVLSRLAALA